jgi:hypothetical protein
MSYFEKNTLKTKKDSSFMNWCKVYDIIKHQQHISLYGLNRICEIKDKINTINKQDH